MKKLIVTLMIALTAACAPESKPGLGGKDGDEGGNDEWSAEALEFEKTCNLATASAAHTVTVRLIVAKTGMSNCLEAAEKILEDQEIDLSGNKIGDVKPLLVFKSIKGLYLSGTGITLKAAGELASLKNLETLDLSDNEFESAPALPPSLKNLNLADNEIEKPGPALAALSKLEKLSLRNNNLKNLNDVPPFVTAVDFGLNPVEKTSGKMSKVSKFFTFGLIGDKDDFSDSAKLAKLKSLKDVYLTNKPLALKLKRKFPKLNFVVDKSLDIE